jgi:hypothetical protein
MRLLLIAIIGVAILSSCNSKSNSKQTAVMDENSSVHHVVVAEVLQTSGYTYLFVNENSKEYWMAINKAEMNVGDELYFEDALQMKGFQSKELDRVFDSVLFVQDISSQPILPGQHAQPAMMPSGKQTTDKLEEIEVSPVPGGITIAELYKNRNDYAGKKVILRGQVVKVNNSIMNRNWVHLQDGTDDSGNYDLTITTGETLTVGVHATFEGIVTLNKDFGAGYSYELIVEEAVQK